MTSNPSPQATATEPAQAPPPLPRNADDFVGQGWRRVDLFAPSDLDANDLGKFVDSAIRVSASDAGEFVAQIRIGTGINNFDGWHRWCVYYLPGPPGIFSD
jgi:hypothetical protein